jgi:predicted RNA-binding Zn-ribbon protein involved in translation (DUF1610 family)
MPMKREVKPECTECGGRMTAGSMVDYRRNVAATGEWVPGEVMTSGWTGAIKNPDRFVTSAWRCEDCGFLKLYARESAPAHGLLG